MFSRLSSPTKLLRKLMHSNTAFLMDARRSLQAPEIQSVAEHSREIARTLSLDSLYSTRNFLAAGSFGEIHRVVRRSDNHHMAMKVLNLKDAHDNEHEMPVIIHNHHSTPVDSVIKVDQVLVERNQMYIITELMKGMDMLDYLLEIGPCSEDLSCRLIRRILKCVSDCHNAGVAHLDIKPDNLMFREEAEDGNLDSVNADGLTLVDFGSARYLSSDEEHLGVNQATGTVGYVAPEVLADRGSIASDMWSVGVVSYMIMTGKMPFPTGQKGVEMTMKGDFKQDSKWHSLSSSAKDFISNLLVVDPFGRMNVNEALEHGLLRDINVSPRVE